MASPVSLSCSNICTLCCTCCILELNNLPVDALFCISQGSSPAWVQQEMMEEELAPEAVAESRELEEAYLDEEEESCWEECVADWYT